MIKDTTNNEGRRKSSKGSSSRPQESNDNAELMDNPQHEAFLDEVADMYNAEQQLIKALPKMAKAARSEELREAFESHLEETEQQAQRIEEAMESIGESVKRKKCKGMEELLGEDRR